MFTAVAEAEHGLKVKSRRAGGGSARTPFSLKPCQALSSEQKSRLEGWSGTNATRSTWLLQPEPLLPCPLPPKCKWMQIIAPVCAYALDFGKALVYESHVPDAGELHTGILPAFLFKVDFVVRAVKEIIVAPL